MAVLAAHEVKNLLYILPLLSGVICLVLVRHLRARAKRESAEAGSGGASLAGLDLLGGAAVLALTGQDDEEEQTPMRERHVAIVVEYDEEGLIAHASAANIAGHAGRGG